MFEWYWLFPFFIVLHLWVTSLFTIFWHRSLAHRQVRTSTGFDTMARIGLWLTGVYQASGRSHFSLRSWVAVHRKHHSLSDSEQDPHTPLVYGTLDLLTPSKGRPGTAYYVTEHEVQQLAPDVPVYNDSLEHFQQKYQLVFWLPLLATSAILFGYLGVLTAVTMLIVWYLWPSVHVCISHSIGYRTRPALNPGDRSLNLFPIGIFFNGEDLAANHHDYPTRVNLAVEWYEFDLGYVWMRFYQWIGMIDIIPTEYIKNYHACLRNQHG
jgi:stearoyl-CoA desaturase (delta-9 desaturase)